MGVKWYDFGAEQAELGSELSEAIARVLKNSQFIRGPEVRAFESEWAAYCGARHCVGLGNGLDSLHLSLRAAGIGVGDEVIVPAHTFVATWLAVTYAGATPVPVDVGIETFTMDPEKFRRAITPRTKAVIPVDLYGNPANVEEITEEAHRHDFIVVEDAAQAHGARVGARTVGSIADITAFSFYPIKNLGAYGDAGAITTNRSDLAERVSLLGNYGSEVKYDHRILGYNSRLDELQAAVLRVKLRQLDRWNGRRRERASRYLDGLAHLGLTLPSLTPPGHVWHVFPILHRRRDALQAYLESAGVPSIIHYPVPPHLLGAYAPLGFGPGAFPISERIAHEELSLPLSPFLSLEDQDEVLRSVAKWCSEA